MRPRSIAMLSCLVVSGNLLLAPLQVEGSEEGRRDFTIRREVLAMRDGVHLSVTYFMPVSESPGERFPVLLEMLPYRKDDSFYIRDYPLHSYWARHGFVSAKVDIRGTGSSEGVVPDREYSDQELDDAVRVIELLAAQPWSNGNVGMWGISWGGFNAIQVAMRQPPALKAILATCASDNLYRDSIDFLDGIFHVDAYHLEIHHENGLPAPPDYKIDDAYLRDRFNQKPWFFTYLAHQRDGAFWRKSALQYESSKLRIPAYLIGGLLDGYRDSIPRIAEHAQVPIQAEIGPWNHSWPHNGEPGPDYEWGREAVRWWNKWLRGEQNGVSDGKRLAVFVRDTHLPEVGMATTPGQWRYEEWPIQRTLWYTLYPADSHTLERDAGMEALHRLHYSPGEGFSAGLWWGEPTPDMRPDDAASLVYDTAPLEETLEIIGFPKVRLLASADVPLADWIARIEDVHPDGRVSLVAAAAINGSQRKDPLHPEALVPGQADELQFDLHFTTWTFRPGHRIRLAVTNSQFPMLWPTPYSMTTTLHIGPSTWVSLPVIPVEKREVPMFAPPEPREERSDAKYLECSSWPHGVQELTRDLLRGEIRYEWKTDCEWEIEDRKYRSSERNFYLTRDQKPAESEFRGDESTVIEFPGRRLELRTVLEVRSDERTFVVKLSRTILDDGNVRAEKQWEETIPRDFQ